MAIDRAQASGPRKVLVLGAAGGVGRATLSLLHGHPLGQALVSGTAELLLLDAEPATDSTPTPKCARWLPAQEIEDRAGILALLDEHRPDEVIELAAVGTWDCMTACAEAGASYMATAYDTWPGTERFDPDDARCMLRARALLRPPQVDVGVHLLCMGMNPGLINIMVDRALRELAARSGRTACVEALDVHTILFTERDETTVADPLEPVTERFGCTWSPEGCLDEVLEPTAMMIRAGAIRELDHAPHRAIYAARCGDDEILGHLVPHEELVSLGARYPSVDLAYCYRMPPAAEAALAAAPERSAQDWDTRRLYPPDHLDDLRGFNRLGVLLCSDSLGELWIGWHTPIAAALRFRTNATLLQVAAGVIAGWPLMRSLAPGVYLPEQLEAEPVLQTAERILGPLRVVHDPRAPSRRVDARRV